MKTQIPEISKDAIYPTTYERQLLQICKGPVWDGDLISKVTRDELVKDGYVERVIDGWNIVTGKGLAYWISEVKKEQVRRKWYEFFSNNEIKEIINNDLKRAIEVHKLEFPQEYYESVTNPDES